MAAQRWALVVSQKQEIPFFSGSWSCPAAAVTRRMTRGGQTDGPEIRLSDAARASRTCRQQPAERPEARLACPYRSGARADAEAAAHDADVVVHDERGRVSCVCPETGEVRAMAFQGFEAARGRCGTLKYRCPAVAFGFECAGRRPCHQPAA